MYRLTEHTFAILDLFNVACESGSTILGVEVKLLCPRPEMLDEFFENLGGDCPTVLGRGFVKEGMHHLNRLVCQFVRLQSTCMNELSPVAHGSLRKVGIDHVCRTSARSFDIQRYLDDP